MIGILDCNNFYASCERVFRPELAQVPIAVLSNNDGCIIARSQEVKDLGVPMGAPLFKWRQPLEANRVKIFSANFVLYGDLSERVMQILKAELPQVEVYSIDEAFFDLSGMPIEQAISLCHLIRKKIQHWLGLTISIGIAPNKTLAKLANRIAKKQAQYAGVYFLPALHNVHGLHTQAIDKLWGVGRNLSASLQTSGIHTIKQLHDMDIAWVRKTYSVVLEKTVRELRGEVCFYLDTSNDYKQHICVARSFGQNIREYASLRAAVVNFISIASEKLRAQQCWAKSVTVFVRTNPFKKDQEQYRAAVTIPLAAPSHETHTLIKAAVQGLKDIYRLDYVYKKAGVMINDILPNQVVQLSLFDAQEKRSALSAVLDSINNKYPVNRESRSAIQFGAVAASHDWRMNQNHRSQRYTTNWHELKIVH